MSYFPPHFNLSNIPDVFSDASIDIIADKLHEQGWIVLDDIFPSGILKTMSDEIESMSLDELSVAGIGRSDSLEVNRNVRRDIITWIDSKSPGQAAYLHAMNTLKNGLNRRLFMGLFDYESHFAIYEPGAFYKIHRDAFRGQKNRILTTVLYLNDTWTSEDGGELVLYNDNEETIGTFLPEFGRLVIFLSEEFPHEVKPTQKHRTSIAGWFRTNQSTANKVDPPR